MFRFLLLEMGRTGLMDKGEYALVYLDAEYDWKDVYHAMNNHFFRSETKKLF